MKPRREMLVAKVLNDPFPPEAIEEVLNRYCPAEGHDRAAMKTMLEDALNRARRAGVPLGNNLGECLTPEDAYLLRQRYISRILAKAESGVLFHNLVCVLIIAIAAVTISWLAMTFG